VNESALSFYDGTNLTADIDATNGTFNSVNTDELSGDWDTLVTTTSELESAFNNLSAGDSIQVAQPDAPYRTTQWLDIDTDDVTVGFESKFADSGEPIVKPADGANVGGIRVGENATASHITIAGFGYDGNTNNQDSTVKNLHGILLERKNAVKDVTIRDVYLTRTHPYHEHNSGGSGITIKDGVENYTLERIHVEDIGDRGIETQGNYGRIRGVFSRNGFDRVVATNVGNYGGSQGARYLTINGVVSVDNMEGSIVKCEDGGSAESAHINVSNVVLYGDGHSAFAAVGNTRDVAVTNIVADHNQGDAATPTIECQSNTSNIEVSNVVSHTPDGAGALLQGTNISLSNAQIYNAGKAGVSSAGTDLKLNNVTIEGAGSDGVYLDAIRATLRGVTSRLNSDAGIKAVDTTSDIDVFNCTTRDNNQASSGAYEIGLAGSDIVVEDTKVRSRGGGFSIGVRSAAADVFLDGVVVPDDAGAYSLNSSSTTLVIGDCHPTPQVDVRNWSPPAGTEMYHDGTNSNTVGPAFYDGGGWTSLVDGTTIS